MRTARGEERGFTFIELVMVTVVLGLLVALALPAYLGTRSKAATDEANHMANEWKSLAWGCYLQYQSASSCDSNTAIGFSEQIGRYWNWVSPTYGVGPTVLSGSDVGLTVSWPATGYGGIEVGQTYTVTLFISSTEQGQATSTCIPTGC